MSPPNRSLPPLSGHWTFVGDVHGRLDTIPKTERPVIQVGDLGIGFIKPEEDEKHLRNRENFWFIRGNHENPFVCQKHPRYLGDWGSHDFMFWVSGAWSIDKTSRLEGFNWWREEELSAEQGIAAFDAYSALKPRLMVTHDGPKSLFTNGGPMELAYYRHSSTASLLQAMFEAHQPEFWFFGHHHESRSFSLNRTHFRCLDCSEPLDVFFQDNSIIVP